MRVELAKLTALYGHPNHVPTLCKTSENSGYLVAHKQDTRAGQSTYAPPSALQDSSGIRKPFGHVAGSVVATCLFYCPERAYEMTWLIHVIHSPI